MAHYPIFLSLQSEPVLLVGGGHVALEKIGSLIDAGAEVTVLAPKLLPQVRVHVDQGQARRAERPFRSGDTQGHLPVMVATDNLTHRRPCSARLPEPHPRRPRHEASSGGVFELVRQGRIAKARARLLEGVKRSQLTPAAWWDNDREKPS